MRRRPGRSTIRTRIVALTLIPIVALLTLWASVMVSMTGDLRALIRLQEVYKHFGSPVDTAVGEIQVERRLAAAYLASPAATARVADLAAQQRSTDDAVRAMRTAAEDSEHQDDLSGEQRGALDAMLDAAAELPALRDKVIARKISWDRAVDDYTAVIEPTFAVGSALTALQAGHLAREAQVVVDLVRVREFVSREDALVAGARAAGGFEAAQYRALTGAIEDRRVFQRTYVPSLPADSRALFQDFERGREYRALTEGEDALLSAGAKSAGKAVAADSWRTTMDRAVKRYMVLCTEAARNSAARARDFARGELLRSGIAGGVGLVAVCGSVWLSVRAGRRISRRLEELRDAADLATQQLPEVMRRLSTGEPVDVDGAAPPLAYGDGDGDGHGDGDSRGSAAQDEIGQVGQALNTARRAAVEAAVKQAGLRRGVFAVLLNIARRNQALVHRQLKLVDTLERRTDDPDVLEDLFRIDHLTTRMRRHAEGLIILSGATPGRRWRNPVPVVEVVGSAVGEIEEYARVVVPPMPAVGVTGQAVADVVHLIAELVENATAFSPPHTQVTMRPEEIRGGFVLRIDDRGLGMAPAELAEANRTLALEGDFDPAQTERLGLYVVGRLAGRHGIEVTLTRSPYGGTTAAVLLPSAILAEASPAAEAAPADAGTPAHAMGSAQAAAPSNGGTAHRAPEPPGPPARTKRVPEAHATGEEARTSEPEAETTAPSEAGERPELPTRVRQASIAPQLRTAHPDPSPAPSGRAADEGRNGHDAHGAHEAEDDVTPERMGAIFGAFQRGLERGRRVEPHDPDTDHDSGSGR
ncbi:nitrate- and nitrite sensing domain-containing protein [Streptomyces sp. 8N616]|uniref:nitrate- and nitrite sensing domain-containing protein n=1 Tax=Streptomyces sp. 8N616 TaxID=3457414 RepID=UPI003FD51FF8